MKWVVPVALLGVALLGVAFRLSLFAAALQTGLLDAAALASAIENTGSVPVYGINFETGTATLTRDSERALREVLALMQAHEDWRVEVQGHAFNLNSKQANQILSGQRATAVVVWLVKHGVDKERLIAKGYGDTQPVADNDTPEGKAKNTRIELKKISRSSNS